MTRSGYAGLLLLALGGCGQNGSMPNATAMSSGLGNAMRAAHGGSSAAVLAGLGSVLRSLTAEQQQQRQTALQEAARAPVGRTISWQSAGNAPARSATAGRQQAPTKETRATYVNKGAATNDQGQKCSKIEETITLPDGKTGKSEQLVCGA